MAVIIETSVGQLTVDLYAEERPRCSKNFLKLCKVKYYNFCLFHSVQHNLVAQTGDPTGTGRGGMSVYGMVYGDQARYFEQEVQPRIKHTKRGQLSMVNNGNSKHGSQFFITLGTDLDSLDGQHTVFGEVAEGWDVLDKLNEAYCDQNHRPYRDIRIFHTVIIDDPFDDPEGLIIPDRSPEPTEEMMQSDRIGVDEAVDDTVGMTQEEVKELMAERESKANAQLLEMVGDIPDVDVAPPDNVLFVCKLNPVTTDEDLSLIFSRFGPIKSCEVIKDQTTGQSLQYAFIEFEDAHHCENAFFKMDNVLIDDRRIHVDFSQSVAKIKHKAKGKQQEEKEEQPRYVLKSQQRRDNTYDLVYEHDLPAYSNDVKKAKKHRQPAHNDSDQGEISRERRKVVENRSSSSASPQDNRDSKRDRETSSREGSRKNRKRERRYSSSEEDRSKEKKERTEKQRSPPRADDRRTDRKRNDRSPSCDEDRIRDNRKLFRSPSSEEDRQKDKRRKEKKKNRSPSSEEDRQKDKRRKEKKKNRSPSSEEDRQKDKRRKEKKKNRSPSSEEDRQKDKKRKDRSSSTEEFRRKEKKKDRLTSVEEYRRKEKKKKDRSSSAESDYRQKSSKDRSASTERERKQKKERNSASSEDERKEGRRDKHRR